MHFVGYPCGKKGWRVYDLELSIFLVSWDIGFCEYEFSYLTNINDRISNIENYRDGDVDVVNHNHVS